MDSTKSTLMIINNLCLLPLNAVCEILSTNSTIRRYTTEAYRQAAEKAAKVHALDRTINEWRQLVDWNLQRQRPMVVIDPNDPEALMYLSERDYRDLQRVCLSNDLPLTVVARKGTLPPKGYNGEEASSPSDASNSDESKTSNSKTPSTSKHPPSPRFIDSRLWTEVRRTRSWIPSRLSELKISGGTESLVDLSEPSQLLQLLMMWGRQTLHYLELGRPGYRMVSLSTFVRHLVRIWKTQGLSRMIALMKIYVFVMYSYLGGDPLKSTEALGIRVRLTNGLPKCFPVEIRNQLRTGSKELIRWWASILHSYKALRALYKPEEVLASVGAEPFRGNMGNWSDGMIPIWSNLTSILGYIPYYKGGFAYGRFSPKSGPNCSTAILGMSLDAYAWVTSGKETIFNLARYWAPDLELKLRGEAVGVNDPYFKTKAKPILSKIGFVFESAGKMRPVAILDIWTQWLLYPFHNFLFEILKKIPSDATFDQEGVLNAYVERFPPEQKHFCYDLKNATDRIPIQLYIEMFIPLLGRPVAEAWGSLLVDRYFRVPKLPEDCHITLASRRLAEKIWPESVKYTRGQPMGAYSSWASLALIHHFIVQFAARESGIETWFSDYLVLGDDLVISNEQVAAAYLRVCESYGITVGLAKSYTSKGLVNFASKTYMYKNNVSPLSLKEEIAATTWSSRVALATRVLSLWYQGEQKELSLLRRIVSNVGWTALQSELQKGRSVKRGLISALTLLAQNPLAVKPEKFNANLVKDWLDTYVLNRPDKFKSVPEMFSRELCTLFVRKAEKSAKDGLESGYRFLGILEAAFENLAAAAKFQMGIGLFQILSFRGWRFINKCSALLAEVEKLKKELDPVTKEETTLAAAQLKAPDLKDPKNMAIMMKAFAKAYKTMMYPKGVTPTIKGQKMDQYLSSEQLLNSTLPRAIALWIEALKWSVIPLDRYKRDGLWVPWERLDKFSLGPKTVKVKGGEKRFVPSGIPHFLQAGTMFQFLENGVWKLGGCLPPGWKILTKTVKEKLSKTGKFIPLKMKYVAFLVPDLSFLFRESESTIPREKCRLPYLEIEELCIRHFGEGPGIPDFLSGPTKGKRDSDRLLRALSAYEESGPPKAPKTGNLLDPELRLLASQIEYLYRKRQPSEVLSTSLELSYWYGFRETPFWDEGDVAIMAKGYDPATWQRHWVEEGRLQGPALLAATAAGVAINSELKAVLPTEEPPKVVEKVAEKAPVPNPPVPAGGAPTEQLTPPKKKGKTVKLPGMFGFYKKKP